MRIRRSHIVLMITGLFLCRSMYAEITVISSCTTNKDDGHSIRSRDVFMNNGQTNLVRITTSNVYKDGKTNVIKCIFYYNNTKVARQVDLRFPSFDSVGMGTYPGTPYSFFIGLDRDGQLKGVGTGLALDPENQLAFDFVDGTFVPQLMRDEIKQMKSRGNRYKKTKALLFVMIGIVFSAVTFKAGYRMGRTKNRQ